MVFDGSRRTTRLLPAPTGVLEINWALADQAFVSACNFATTVVLVRALGYDQFGIFALAWAGVMAALSLHHPLVTAPMLALAPKASPGDVAQHHFYASRVHLVVSPSLALCLGLLAVSAGAILNHDSAAGLAIPLVAAVLTATSQDLVRRYQFSIAMPRSALASDVITYGGKLVLLIALAVTGSLSPAVALLCVAAAAAAGCLPGLARLMQKPASALPPSERRRHRRYSHWMTAMSVLRLMYEHLYLVVVALFAGPGAAGVLRAVQTIVGVLHVLFSGVQNIGVPRASNLLARQSPASFRRYVLHLCLLVSALTVAFLLVVNIAPSFLLTLVYGNEGSNGVVLLRLFSLLYLLLAFTIPFAIALRAAELTREVFIIQAVSTGSTLITLVLILPVTGTIGAVWALAVGGVASLVGHIHYYRNLAIRGTPATATAQDKPADDLA